jgi:glycosyltransferase involved in cell wall biosynthesis
MVELSVVVPIYNEEKGIQGFLNKLKDVLKNVKISHEIIAIDDASSDKTFENIKNVKDVKVIRHPYNKGYGASLKTGVRNSSGKYVLFIDGDGEHDPNNIPKIVKYRKDYDMIVGARQINSSTPRAIAKKIITGFANYVSEIKIPDLNCGFRLVRKDIMMDYLDTLPNKFSFTSTITMIFIKSGYSIKYVPINILKRSGKSKINPVKDFINFLVLIMKTSLIFSPLKVFLPISLLFFVLGMSYLVYSIVLYANIPDTAIFLLTTSIIIFFFGFISDQISSLKLSKSA